ncbi:hypothetical protein [Mycoplasmoides alvi]|uniref:hypothetical protein n=1 Tax=Mycoplasmoides alvi TaxID=78580 RepID=UPI00051AD895|nr:hypothetical protein [Mycoplasmoides alvi]
MVKTFESWNKWLKFLIVFFTLGYFSAIYRIVYYFEKKTDKQTLLFGLISLIPIIGFIAWICDLYSIGIYNQIILLIW